MATTGYRIARWHDIPAQIKVKAGRARAGKPLSERFQVYSDHAAMRAGLFNTDDCLREWRPCEAQEREGEPEAGAEAVAAELEAAYPDSRLARLVNKGGRD